MPHPGSPSSGNSVDSFVPPAHTDTRETAETGTTSTRQSVSPHPAGKHIPENGRPGRNSGLPENIQTANATGNMVSPNRMGGAEGIKRNLNTLLAVDQPLEKSFKTIAEMKYIDATATALEKIKEEMSDKWDLPNSDLIAAFKKAHKTTIKQLKKDGTGDVKVTFNSPDGQRIRLIPPELDDLDLSDLQSWMQRSLELVNTLKLEKQAVINSALTEQTITDGNQKFNSLLSQLAQLGSSEEEIQGFQARYDSIQHPIISLYFDGSSLQSSGRPRNVSTPEPRPAIEITNDPEKEPVVFEDGDSTVGAGRSPSMETDHKQQVEKAKKAYEALTMGGRYGDPVKPSEEMFDAKAKLMAELEQRLQDKPEDDEDTDSVIAPPEFPPLSPEYATTTPTPPPEWRDDAHSSMGEFHSFGSSSDITGSSEGGLHLDNDDSLLHPVQPLPMLPIKNDDGVGLFRTLLAYRDVRSWHNASEDQVRERMKREDIAQPVKQAILEGINSYLFQDFYSEAQRSVAQKLNKWEDKELLASEIFDRAMVNGTFSGQSFSRLPEVLGITSSRPDDRFYTFEMRLLSVFITDNLPKAFKVPISNGNEPGVQRLAGGGYFGLVAGTDEWQDGEDHVPTLSSPPSPETGPSSGSAVADSFRADNQPPAPPPIEGLEGFLNNRK
ncbi:hypothetical protein [Endozoicomonas sp. SCSIO W0465]|uniref:hypothetical protein n=1 Tax=Endozoicomonas sp. SCSIO W0465 TaxID=2918516 RepID=UPI00207545FE|nr:hypothetical protein [Endozoicomonas sp. SCSIO W0465]USE37502.1 hypothetical protein MJO57_04580 [Endozoicomonas sp. SCSIO W0465]